MKLHLLIPVLATMAPSVLGHATEIRHCITAESKLRIFIQHWHGEQKIQSSDTMVLRANHENPQRQFTSVPTGSIYNVQDLSTGLPGCEHTISDAVTKCSANHHDDWVWYDFDATLGVQVSYTILTGNSVFLTEGCPELFPATIAGILAKPDEATIKLQKKTTNAAAGIFGDPHYITWSGEHFDFQGECDLLLLENPSFADGLGMTIHTRTEIKSNWSYVAVAAIKIGDSVLELEGGTDTVSHRIDGLETPNMVTGDATLGDFSVHFNRINAHQSKARVDLGHGDAISMETFKDFVRINIKDKSKKAFVGSNGLLGVYPTGQRTTRDGVTVMEDDNMFGQEWQVRFGEEPALFHNEGSVSYPTKCVMPEQTPMKQETSRRLGEVSITQEDAAFACARVSEADRDACIFDVMATYDLDMAGSY